VEDVRKQRHGNDHYLGAVYVHENTNSYHHMRDSWLVGLSRPDHGHGHDNDDVNHFFINLNVQDARLVWVQGQDNNDGNFHHDFHHDYH
jgi:hypothetical protein